MYTDLFSSMDHYNNPSVMIFPLLMLLWVYNMVPLSKEGFMGDSSSPFLESMLANSLFVMIIFLNLFGLFPLYFGVTTQFLVLLLMTLTMFTSLTLSMYVKNFKEALASLMPSGAPMYLAPFLALIELISYLIRPLTLSLRLMANISAGHLILTLLATAAMSTIWVMPIMMFYNLFEVMIAIIQAYIMTTLIKLYSVS